MRIAQISPLFEAVPPKAYGGTERVVSWLTEELVRQGHEVTLFASGDSRTKAELVACSERALWQDATCLESLPHHVRQLEMVFERASEFDILHFHGDFVHFPLLRRLPVPAVTTLHGALNRTDHLPFFLEYREANLVSISDSQRATVPEASFSATVYHGMPPELHHYSARGSDYLAFVGRASPQKGLDRAISIAMRSKTKLKIAARIYAEERGYFSEVIAPLLAKAGPLVEFVGEVAGEAKDELLRGARALLFPISWAEPFGLVMIEALATGTPVIAWRNGSVPEVIDHGRTGFIVESEEAAVSAIGVLDSIERAACRASFERRFSAARMASDYVEVYRTLTERCSGADWDTKEEEAQPRSAHG
ncbi:MAG TPA: glycosyltransferase family 4 protein [Polyangiaceae bacterium]|nr:glycosyltransferase family 4 protein [Polyangiaceae bacterium]